MHALLPHSRFYQVVKDMHCKDVRRKIFQGCKSVLSNDDVFSIDVYQQVSCLYHYTSHCWLANLCAVIPVLCLRYCIFNVDN